MRIDVFTLFPGLIDNFADESLLGRAQERDLLDVRAHNIRDHTDDNHHTVDDAPFGGGAGMVMLPDPIFRCVEAVQPPRPLFLMGPGGRVFDQQMAQELSEGEGFSLLCGRYEGVDQRVHDELIDDEVSIGDYVLGGGEVAALVIIEAVGRLVPGVMGNDVSGIDESFSDGLLEYPQYTRPKEYRGMGVPDVLRSGDHGKVDRWRKAMALQKTLDRRPDLIEA
ncbi:MAG: tRNA (guanosine(37)-N1)-methyltransferase TrmD, partial [Acidimicrobiales bacterium]